MADPRQFSRPVHSSSEILAEPAQSVKLVLPEGLQALPEAAWCASADGQCFIGNDRWCASTGAAAAGFSLARWLQALHPDDQPASADAWDKSIATSGPFEAVVRVRRAEGDFGWMLARATLVRDGSGLPRYWAGIATDIDCVKAGEALTELVANELAHRIGNLFAVVGGMLSLSARGQAEVAGFARSTGARISALAQAHAFIWPPAAGGDAAPQSVTALISQLLDPYATPDGPQIDVGGDDVVIGRAMATCVTLAIHELATNAAKYGALSNESGRVAVRLRRRAGHMTILWVETGGPVIEHVPTREGFGTSMIDRLTRLGQTSRTRRWWRRDGLVMALNFRLDTSRQ
jgi:PAS domain S-box-containing protein